jgi:hypothetical protein
MCVVLQDDGDALLDFSQDMLAGEKRSLRVASPALDAPPRQSQPLKRARRPGDAQLCDDFAALDAAVDDPFDLLF